MKKNEKKLRKKINWGKVVAIAVFATLLSSILFIAIAMAMAPSEPNPAEPYRRVKGDYVLMLLQCIVGVAAMLLPSLLKRTLNLVIPSKMMLLFAVFLYCAIYRRGTGLLLQCAALGHYPTHLQRRHAGGAWLLRHQFFE